MERLRIDGTEYEGTDKIMEGLNKKMAADLKGKEWTEEEQREVDFLLKDIKKINEKEDDYRELEREVEDKDLEEIWKDVDMTSAPGEDGLTYGALKFLCENN